MTRRATIVVPTYNEAARLPPLLAGIAAFDATQSGSGSPFSVQFLIVDDGSRPEEAAETRRLLESHNLASSAVLLRFERNRGKGAALHDGFQLALSSPVDYVGFIDGDSSIGIDDLHRALCHLDADPQLGGVIGSRVQMLGYRVARSPLRHYVGRLFATFVSLYFHCQAYDTQCGLKVFRAMALRPYLDVPSDTRWTWDTQLLLAMLEGGERVHEMPINWLETPRSKVSLVRDPAVMVCRLIWFKRRLAANPRRPN